MNHSALHRCQASHTAHRLLPAVGWHALALRRCGRSPLQCLDATSPRLPSAAASSLVSCLLVENTGSLLPSVILKTWYSTELIDWFQPADCTATVILSYSRNPVRTVMIPSIRDTRGPGTVARDTATSQQHATKSTRIYSEVETAQNSDTGPNTGRYWKSLSSSAVDGTIFIVLTFDDEWTDVLLLVDDGKCIGKVFYWWFHNPTWYRHAISLICNTQLYKLVVILRSKCGCEEPNQWF